MKERVKFGSKIILSVVNGAISKSVKMKRLRDSEEKDRRKASKKRKVEERDAGSKDFDAEVEQSKKRQKYNNKEGVAGSSKEQSVEKRTGNYEYLESEKNVFFNKFGTLQDVNNGTGRKEHNSKIARRTTGARENLNFVAKEPHGLKNIKGRIISKKAKPSIQKNKITKYFEIGDRPGLTKNKNLEISFRQNEFWGSETVTSGGRSDGWTGQGVGADTSRISRFQFRPGNNFHNAGVENEHLDSLAVSCCVFTDEDLVKD